MARRLRWLWDAVRFGWSAWWNYCPGYRRYQWKRMMADAARGALPEGEGVYREGSTVEGNDKPSRNSPRGEG